MNYISLVKSNALGRGSNIYSKSYLFITMKKQNSRIKSRPPTGKDLPEYVLIVENVEFTSTPQVVTMILSF